MTKKVIVLWGKADTGKSGTILKIYKLLKSKYKDATSESKIVGEDVRVILTINGIKVGIESQGDPGGRLLKSLKSFVKVNCRVIICATRTRGQTVDAVNNLKQHGYEIIWHQQDVKQNTTEQDSNNLKMANTIVREVSKIIGI